jgi:hypothetical protein
MAKKKEFGKKFILDWAVVEGLRGEIKEGGRLPLEEERAPPPPGNNRLRVMERGAR